MVHNSEQEYVTKLSFYRQKSGSLAEAVREMLQFVEHDCLDLPRRDSAFIVDYLRTLDAIQQQLQKLAGSGAPNLTPETLRFTVVQQQVLRRAGAILGQLGGSEGLRRVRPAGMAENEAPWWFLDAYLARRRSKLLRKALQGLAIIVAFGLAVIFVFNVLIKPDQNITAHSEYYNEAFNILVRKEDYAAALVEIERAQAYLPDDPETLLFKGIVLEELGRTAEADAVFERAAALVPEPEKVLFLRTRLLLELGKTERAALLAREAIKLKPDFPEAWLMLGLAYSDLGEITRAYESMQQAARLAEEQDNGALQVMIRVNMSNLTGRQR